MIKELAINILDSITEYGENRNEKYNIKLLDRREYEDRIKSHTFYKGGDILDMINISREDSSYYFLFIEWRPKNNEGNYYIVVLPPNKSGLPSKSKVYIEIHKTENEYNSMNLIWTYSPSKQGLNSEDSKRKNDKRKEYFKGNFGNLEKLIHTPNSTSEVEKFLNDIFTLVKARIESDSSNL